MKRTRKHFLLEWLKESRRKPLVIRGARQVGKTWLVRDFARSSGLKLLELNFEKRPELESLFSSNDPKQILVNLNAFFRGEVNPLSNLLFLDEIQAAPQLLAKLRWFAEDMPQLPVIAAGSLLEFALDKHEFSMPVGRINYMHLEPLSFEEFLVAIGKENLRDYIEQYVWSQTIPSVLHLELMDLIKDYLLVGGMPAAVLSWVEKRNPEKVSQIHLDLLATYRDDFSKYSGRLSTDRLEEVMNTVPRQLSEKFVYSKVNSAVETPPLKQALELLCKSRVCHRILHTSGNGLPLGAEINEKFVKVIMLDCGLCTSSLGLSMQHFNALNDFTMVNSGGIAEQLVGQILRTLAPPYVSPSLYYWQRTKKGGAAEVDYLIQHEAEVIPIEVKAGSTGSLKSLHQFMKEKKKTVAVRINSDFPSKGFVSVQDYSGSTIEYTLFSLPFYLLGQLHRLLSTSTGLQTFTQ
jgi:predicted AAA+ superfamily ATPase